MGAFYLLIAVTLFFALRGLLGKDKLFEYPTLVSLLYLAFFVPQVLAIERGPLQNYEPWILWLYMTLCLLMIGLGFAVGKRWSVNRAAAAPAPKPDVNMLSIGAVTLAALGLLAISQVRQIAASSDLGSSWTGVITLWYLLMQANFYAFAISLLNVLWGNRNKLVIAILCISFITIVIMITGTVKRHMIAELALLLAGAWFFIKGKQPPKVLVVIACLLGTVLIHQVGSIRGYVSNGYGSSIDAVLEGVPFREFHYFTSDEAPEISQALLDVYSVNQTGDFEGPASLWNKMVHQYVPAFIVGQSFKDSLKVESNVAVEVDYRLESYDRQGATHTGFSDTYRSYWVFGSLVLFGIGMFMGWLYGFAINGRLWAQFYYLILLNDGLVALTESTDRYFVSAPIVFALTFFFVRPGWRTKKNGPRGRRRPAFMRPRRALNRRAPIT